MCWSIDATDVTAARDVRRAAAGVLAEHASSPEIVADAELVIGELLANAARHGGGHVCLEIGYADGLAQVSLHDSVDSFTLDIRPPDDEFSESGRGLYIVSKLTRRIDVKPKAGSGKRINVTLDVRVPDGDGLEPTCSRAWLRGGDLVCMAPRIAMYGIGRAAAKSSPQCDD